LASRGLSACLIPKDVDLAQDLVNTCIEGQFWDIC